MDNQKKDGIVEIKKTFPVTNYRFNIILFENEIDFVERFKELNFSHENFEDYPAFTFEHDQIGFICLKTNNNLLLKHIVHECKHLLNYMFKWIGQDLDPYNDELECYFLEWTFDEVYKSTHEVLSK